VSREKKMMFHDASKALDAAIVEVRRQMEATNARQPQDNSEVCQPHREKSQPKE
jgi:hypothetical protein